MSAVLVAEKLSKWYGSVIAVNNVSFALNPGITALLGPNGAGKSTLIAMFTGQLRQTRGTVKVLGESVWNNHLLNLRIGLCHQFDNFYEDMSAIEFITLMARLTGFRGRGLAGRVRDELARVGLEESAWKRPIATYSKGMRQRVKLAQAVMHDPELLFLDEPMTGLDPIGRHEIANMIKDFAAMGRSVLISTHILHEVETLTDQILLVAFGRVIAEGEVHEIRESLEHHPYTIRVRCDAPRRLGLRLAEQDHVSSI
ncbi:MAG: ABC transporter ATP-binding protein, partial [Planctomycetes bacterium]|nr:ABC transporter ATP-binding protein [Planctomycetota bacterium]